MLALIPMDNLTAEDRREIAQMSRLHTVTIDLIRHWDERCIQSQRHDHSVAVWVVGLCAGAVAAIGHLLNPFWDVKSLTLWQLTFLYGPFVFGIVFGIAHSIILTRLMEAGYKHEVSKYSALAAIPFTSIHGADDIRKIRATISAIALGKDEQLHARERELGMPRLNCWLQWIQHVPMLMFGAGIVAVVIAVFSARGEPMLLDSNWIEPLQATLAITGSWFLAYGIVHTIKMSIGGAEQQVFSTSRPAIRNWKFWLGLVLITLAGIPPVLKFFWRL